MLEIVIWGLFFLLEVFVVIDFIVLGDLVDGYWWMCVCGYGYGYCNGILVLEK